MVVAKVPVAPANNEGGIAYGAGSIWLPTDPKGDGDRAHRRRRPTTSLATIPVRAGLLHRGLRLRPRVGVEHREERRLGDSSGENKVIAEIPVDKRAALHGGGRRLRLDAESGHRHGHQDRSVDAEGRRDDRGRACRARGGDIAADEGAVWVTIARHPADAHRRRTPTRSRTSSSAPAATACACCTARSGCRTAAVNNVWRIQTASPRPRPAVVDDARRSRSISTRTASPICWSKTSTSGFPGQPTTFRVKPLRRPPARASTLKTTLNGKKAEVPFVKTATST